MKKKKIRKFYKCEEPKCRSGKSSDGLPKFWCQISRASEIEAALIREAGSWESRKPDGWAHQYHNCIRFNQGETVNGEQPFHAVPYWLETNGEAGSERERELRELVTKSWAGFQVICVISLFMVGFVAVLCLHYESEIKSFCRWAEIKKLLEKRQ